MAGGGCADCRDPMEPLVKSKPDGPGALDADALAARQDPSARKVQVGFGIALGFLSMIGVAAYLALGRLNEAVRWVEHARDVLRHLDAVQIDSLEARNAHRGFVVTGDPAHLGAQERAERGLPGDLARLLELTADNPAQRPRVEELERAVKAQLGWMREVNAVRSAEGFGAAQAKVTTGEGRRLVDRVRALAGELKEAEEVILAQRSRQAERNVALMRAVIVGGSVLAFGCVGLAWGAIRRDFAGRRRSEEALRRSEESLAVTLASIGDAVLATDTAGRVIRMNPVAEKLTGWTNDEAFGRPVGEVFRIVNEATRAPTPIPVAAVLATGEVQALANHTVLIARDGGEHGIADSAAPIRDRKGRVVGVVLVFRDVTAERANAIKLEAARAELARERARLQVIFDAVPIGISFVRTTPEGRSTRLINDAHLRICGMTREEAVEQEAFVQRTHPDDRARQAELVGRLEAGEIDRGSIDKRYVKPDGSTTWVMLSFQRYYLADRSREDLSIVVDITERKEAVAELERFFSLSLDFLCISSVDGYFKRVSPAVTDILGWSPEEFLARPFMEFVHPEDWGATQREVEHQIATGEKVFQFENRYRHKDGSWRVLSWRSVPQENGLMYATARDVTERNRAESEIKRLNEQLRQRATELEEANRELEAFSYSVSHDLRAPLRHIEGYVGMLTREAEGVLSEKAAHYLRTITGSSRLMTTLIDDLLEFSRMGRTDMRMGTVNLNAIVDQVRDELDLGVRDRDIRWTVYRLPAVNGDAALLKQVYVNLLDNAVKYTRGRSPAEIEIGTRGEEGGRVVLYVRDNGAGFDMKYADKLFGVFQRFHSATEFEGTGIGLANVRRIVLRHGGRTWAEAAPDVGATIFFTLAVAGPQGEDQGDGTA